MSENKSSRRRFLRLAGLSAMGATLAACAPPAAPLQAPAEEDQEEVALAESAAPVAEEITLSLVVDQNLAEDHAAHAERWMDAHPNVTIDFEGKELGPSEQRMARLAADTMPDVYRTALNEPPTYGVRGLMYNLVEIAQEMNIIDKYIPAVWDGYKYHDAVYCLPNDTNTLCLWCNTHLFEEAGIIDLLPPKNWEEVVQVCEAVAQPSEDPSQAIYGYAEPTTITWSAFFYWWWCWREGNDFYDYENDEMLFNDERAAEAISKIRFLVENRYLPHYDNWQDPWYGGRSAMQTFGSWAIHGDIPGPWNNNDPQGKWEADYERPEFVLTTNPVLREGVPPYGVLAGFGWAFPTSNKYLRESVEFIWDWISDPEFGTVYLTKGKQIPCVTVIDHPWLETNAWSAFQQQLETAKPLLYFPAIAQVNDECLAPRLIQAYAGEISSEQVLQEAYDCGVPIIQEASS